MKRKTVNKEQFGRKWWENKPVQTIYRGYTYTLFQD